MNTILYFTASWCKPCKTIAPVIEEIIRADVDAVQTFVLDHADGQAEAINWQVGGLPTFILCERENGSGLVEIKRISGVSAETAPTLKKWAAGEP